jgi:hypothetical protein
LASAVQHVGVTGRLDSARSRISQSQ